MYEKSHNILKCAGFFLLPVVHEAQGGATYADFRTEEWLEDRQASGHGGPGSEHVIDEKYMVYTFDCQCLVLAERESPMDIAAFAFTSSFVCVRVRRLRTRISVRTGTPPSFCAIARATTSAWL